MADIAASGVTYTEQSGSHQNGGSQNVRVFTVAFGDGTDTYPSGGVPITKGSVGCPTDIQSAKILDASDADGFVYKYDMANDKIRIYTADYDATADGALIELTGGATAVSAATLYIEFRGY